MPIKMEKESSQVKIEDIQGAAGQTESGEVPASTTALNDDLNALLDSVIDYGFEDFEFDDSSLLNEGAEDSEPREVQVISSFEEMLDAVRRVDHDQPAFTYLVKSQDGETEISTNDERLLLDYLPVYIAKNPKKLAKPTHRGNLAFKHISEMAEFSRLSTRFMLDGFDCMDILSSSQLIEVKGDLVSTPYGSISFSGHSPAEIRLNPLILTKIVDAYSSTTIFDRRELLHVIRRNIVDNYIGDSDSNREVKPSRVFKFLFDDGPVISHLKTRYGYEYMELLRDAKNCYEILERLFFSSILPVAFLNNDFKANIGCSLLASEEISDHSMENIKQAFIYFLCRNEQIARVANSKLLEIQSLDAKAIFSGKISEISESERQSYQPPIFSRRPTSNGVSRNSKVKARLAIDNEKTEEVELDGKVITDSELQAFSDLCGKHPHFSPVFSHLLPFIEASFSAGVPLVFPPLLIAGPPGIGKTKFISELFEALGFPISHCHSSQFTCGSGLVGLQSTWGTAQPGYVSQAIRTSRLYNPLIAFDELERIRMASYGGNGVSVEAAFMRLLEPLEASRFVDACGQNPVDVSKVSWVFTCNDPSMIPPALLTRLNKVCVYPPTKEHDIDSIHRDIWADLVNQFAAGSRIQPWISEDAMDHLREVYYGDLNFRATIKVLKLALSRIMAGALGTNYLTLDVIELNSRSKVTLN